MDYSPELAILNRALSEPFGVAVATSEPHVLRQRLNRARLDEHKDLTITFSPLTADAVWVVRKEHYDA